MNLPPFRFKKIEIEQSGAAHPVGTDGILLGAWAAVESSDRRVLDIGTGTGLVALMLAQRTENQRIETILGVESHPPSARLAAKNFEKSAWRERLCLVENSIQNFADIVSEGEFDLIVSNPPFFSEKNNSPDPARRAARHIASLPPANLIFVVKKLLAPHGRFCTILPKNFGENFCQQAAVAGLYFAKITEISGRTSKPIERVLLEFRHEPQFFVREKVSVFDENGLPSGWFRDLTADFYLT